MSKEEKADQIQVGFFMYCKNKKTTITVHSNLSLKNIFHSFLFVIIWITNTCTAQWIGDSTNEAHILKGIQYVYNLSFDSAKVEFQQVARAMPDHPAGHFFLATVEWWRIITDIDNKSRDDKFIAMMDKVIDICDKRLDQNENDIVGLFFKGGALGFQGRLYGNREDWIKAANCGRTALPIVQRAYKLEPNNYDVLLGIGIYNYYAAIVPDIYPWVKPFMIFFPKGERIKGLSQLRTASEKAIYANVEASYFLMQAFQNFEKQPGNALDLALRLHSTFPNNVIFHKYVGRCYSSLGNWTEMKQTFTQILERVRKNQLGYDASTEREAHYYLGLEAMTFARYDTALQYFYRTDELSRLLDVKEPSGFMVMTNLKIGMIYDLQTKRDLAIMQYQKVLDMKDYQDAHKQAKEYIKNPYQKS